MFILFMAPAWHGGPDDPEMERANDPGWEDHWTPNWTWNDLDRDPTSETRFEWRAQRFVDASELLP